MSRSLRQNCSASNPTSSTISETTAMSSMASFSGSSRGGFAPRRGRGRGGRVPHFSKPKEQVKPDIHKNPLGKLVKIFHVSDLEAGPGRAPPDTEISDCQYVASYSWLNSQTPTIIVPGKPPQWTPLQTPRRLDEDSGRYFRDPNAAKFPEYPMASVVRAILKAQPEYPTEDIDLFACGSTLGNLLRFARGVDKAFRFTVEVVQDTVFFVRKENDPREIIEGIHGFGHTFPENYTTWEQDVKGSDTHQRIMRYAFGGLECLVRFESDGYIKESSKKSNTCSKSTSDEDDLLQALQDVALSTSSIIKNSTSNDLIVKRGGSEVPQNSIFDLKTRSGRYKKDIDMSDIYPQLWLKQIPNFIVAYHDGAGLFQDIRVQNVKDGVQGWKKDNVDGIRRFAELLNKILEIAKNSEESVLDVYCPGADRLEIREPFGPAPNALPTELRSCWRGKAAQALPAHDKFLAPKDDVEYQSCDSDDDFEYSGDHEPEYTFGVDSDDEPDYTACSAHDCGYCGKCSY